MAGLSLKGKITETPVFKTVGKKDTPLTELKVVEDIRKKVDGEWKTVGKNLYEVNVWGEKAMEAQFLAVGDIIDASAQIEKKGDNEYVSFRCIVNEETWEYKGKNYSKLQTVMFDWDKIETDND